MFTDDDFVLITARPRNDIETLARAISAESAE